MTDSSFEVTKQDFHRAFSASVRRMRAELPAEQWAALVDAGVHRVLEVQAGVTAALAAQGRFLDNAVHAMTFNHE